MRVDGSGNLYVADQGNHRILRFNNADSKSNGDNADGVYGQIGFSQSASGTSPNTMSAPSSVAIDASGALYVLDQDNRRVLRFASASTKTGNGVIAVNADGVIGQSSFSGNGTGTSASTLNYVLSGTPDPAIGLAVDGNGRLYISDKANNREIVFQKSSFWNLKKSLRQPRRLFALVPSRSYLV